MISIIGGDPGAIRTRGLRIRNPMLYPAELRGQRVGVGTMWFFEERANGFGHSLAKTKKAGLCFLDISRCVF